MHKNRFIYYSFACLLQVAILIQSAAAVQAADFKWNLWNGEIKLRGANIWQRLVTNKDGGSMGDSYIGPPYRADPDFKQLNLWGSNYVNISHPGIFFEKPDPATKKYKLDKKSLENLHKLVDQCREQGLYVVISFRTGPERNEEKIFDKDKVSKLWKTPLAQDAWREMWRQTAEEFKDVSNVVGYELMVEPELKTGSNQVKDQQKADQWNQFAASLIRSIRGASPGGAGDIDTPILVGGIGMSDIHGLMLLDPKILDPHHDQKIVYNFHQYIPGTYTQQDEKSNRAYDCQTRLQTEGKAPKYVGYLQKYKEGPESLNATFKQVSDWRARYSTPDYIPAMAVNEFGVMRWAGAGSSQPDAKIFLAEEYAKINELKLNNAIWKWDTYFCTGDDDYNFRHGEDFSSHTDNETNPLAMLIKHQWQLDSHPLRP